MAINNKRYKTNPALENFIDFRDNEDAISASAGTNTSTVVVPNGEVWQLQNVMANNPDASGRDIEVYVTDAADNPRIQLVPRATVATGGFGAQWVAQYQTIIPAGWKIVTKWYAMTASGALRARLTALNLAGDV